MRPIFQYLERFRPLLRQLCGVGLVLLLGTSAQAEVDLAGNWQPLEMLMLTSYIHWHFRIEKGNLKEKS